MNANEFSGQIWRYTHTHDPVGRVIILSADGRISGHYHANEARWAIKEDQLVFLSDEGDISVRFKKVTRTTTKTVIKGDFVLWANSGIEARLLLLPYSEMTFAKSLVELNVNIETVAEKATVPYVTVPRSSPADGDSYVAPELTVVRANNVTLHTKFCIIQKDGFLLKESFFHFPFHLEKGIAAVANNEFYKAPTDVSVEFDTALHAISGVSGNYYHWMMFFIAKMNSVFYNELERSRLIVLLPDFLSDAQKESADIVAKHYGLNIVHVIGGSSIRVKNLIFPFQPHSAGLDTHPATNEVFDIIKSKLYELKTENAERIYITRSDSNFRRLANEAEIEAYLVTQGFSIVSLTGKTLKEQVNILAAAKTIISPHGAGLTNLMYCSEGTRVLELHSPAHINWCMKRICALRKLPYMHLIGEMAPSLGGDTYKVDMNEFLEATKLLLAHE